MPELRRDYEPDLSVLRQTELEKHQDWWRGTKRLEKVYGPPGVGKSWFLQQVSEGLPSEAKNWLFIDARDAKGATTPAELSSFIKNLVGEFQKKCPHIPDYDSIPAPAALLQHVVEALCQECGQGKQFLFLVDQCDDLLEDDVWHNFERTILNSLAWTDCTRFVVAMREEQNISISALRYSYKLLELSSFSNNPNHQGDEQLRNLAKKELGPETTAQQVDDWVQDLKVAFPGVYNWRHPTLNLFLFEQHRDNTLTALRTDPNRLLGTGLSALTALPADLPKLSTLTLIRKLVEKRKWLRSELEEYVHSLGLGLTRTDSVWGPQLDPLTERGFTVNVGNRYGLADEIYEFVLACV